MDVNILSLINNREFDDLSVLFAHMNPVDIAEVLENAEFEQSIAAFRTLDDQLAADVFSYISPEHQELYVAQFSDKEVESIMEDMSVDDMVDLIEDMPENLSKRVLENVSTEKGELVDRILDYPEDSAGSVMTTEMVELLADMTVKDALNTIRTTGVDKETIYTCYVVDYERKLVGVVTADTLLYAQFLSIIGNLMDTNIISAQANEDREELAARFSKYDLLAMPVVNRSGQLVGIITVDDIIRVITEEDTEDFEKLVGIKPSDDPYMKTGIFKLARSRILWLMILMFTAMIAGFILEQFEDALAGMQILVAFIPMLMGAGGNAGSQASTVVIRGMAIGEITVSDIFKLIWKEARIAVICSVVLGFANFIRIFFMYNQNYTLAWVVTLSLCITLIVAKTIGCTIPIIAKLVKIDAAVMAAPLITTIVDATALIVFFMIARSAFNL